MPRKKTYTEEEITAALTVIKASASSMSLDAVDALVRYTAPIFYDRSLADLKKLHNQRTRKKAGPHI
jgi:hypothetical protein